MLRLGAARRKHKFVRPHVRLESISQSIWCWSRSNIEEDVLHAINNHKELSSRYGDDFIAVGHHKVPTAWHS